MPLVLHRKANETWREAAQRYAHKYSLDEEVLEAYDGYVKNGTDEAKAAFDACWNWDVLDYEEGT